MLIPMAHTGHPLPQVALSLRLCPEHLRLLHVQEHCSRSFYSVDCAVVVSPCAHPKETKVGSEWSLCGASTMRCLRLVMHTWLFSYLVL